MLRQEIEQLHDKVDTEESRTLKLEEKLKRSETERVLYSQRISDLSKEQEIGNIFLIIPLLFKAKYHKIGFLQRISRGE